VRNPTEGRDYYDRRKADGKTSMEAVRAPESRLSNIVCQTMVDNAIAHAVAGAGTGRGEHPDTTLTPARPAHSPHTNSSDEPLPGPAITKLPAGDLKPSLDQMA